MNRISVTLISIYKTHKSFITYILAKLERNNSCVPRPKLIVVVDHETSLYFLIIKRRDPFLDPTGPIQWPHGGPKNGDRNTETPFGHSSPQFWPNTGTDLVVEPMHGNDLQNTDLTMSLGCCCCCGSQPKAGGADRIYRGPIPANRTGGTSAVGVW